MAFIQCERFAPASGIPTRVVKRSPKHPSSWHCSSGMVYDDRVSSLLVVVWSRGWFDNDCGVARCIPSRVTAGAFCRGEQ